MGNSSAGASLGLAPLCRSKLPQRGKTLPLSSRCSRKRCSPSHYGYDKDCHAAQRTRSQQEAALWGRRADLGLFAEGCSPSPDAQFSFHLQATGGEAARQRGDGGICRCTSDSIHGFSTSSSLWDMAMGSKE